MLTIRKYGGISGFLKTDESEYDVLVQDTQAHQSVQHWECQ